MARAFRPWAINQRKKTRSVSESAPKLKSKHVLSFVPQNFAFYLLGKHAKSSKLAEIGANNRDVTGMGLFSILRLKLICNAKFLGKQDCKAVCDVKSRI